VADDEGTGGEQLLDAVLTIAGDLGLETILERIVQAACTLVDARYGALGVIAEEGERLSAFVHRGLDAEAAATIGELPHGRGLLGTLIEHPAPLRLGDLREHPDSFGFPQGHPPMRTFLGVPIRVRGEVFGNLYLTEKGGDRPFTPEDERLVVGLAAVAGAAVQHARSLDDARRRDAWRDAVLEISAAVVDQEPAHLVRTRIVELACSLVEADGGVLVESHDEGVWVLASVGDAPPEGFLDAGTSTAVDTLSEGTSHRTSDGPVFGRPSMWVGIRDERGVVATVGVGRSSAGFTSVEEQLLEAFASQASVAWTYERAQREVHRLSLLAERERIGRDLHDTVIQRLFATGLSLQATARRVEHDVDVAQRLERAVDDIDATVREIRSTIFALQGDGTRTTGIRSRVLEVIEEVAPSLPRAPRVRFDGPIDSVVGEDVAAHLLPVVREALTNVAKHAHATDVEIDLQVDTDGLRLRIADDGRGIATSGPRGFGLRNLGERASSLGGSCEVTAGPGGRGTVVLWSLPAR
jgi:signal transduction histidine kinase